MDQGQPRKAPGFYSSWTSHDEISQFPIFHLFPCTICVLNRGVIVINNFVTLIVFADQVFCPVECTPDIFMFFKKAEGNYNLRKPHMWTGPIATTFPGTICTLELKNTEYWVPLTTRGGKARYQRSILTKEQKWKEKNANAPKTEVWRLGEMKLLKNFFSALTFPASNRECHTPLSHALFSCS